MQGAQTIPAEAPLNLLQGLAITDQDAHRLAVQRVTGLQLTDREHAAEIELAHGTNASDESKNAPTSSLE